MGISKSLVGHGFRAGCLALLLALVAAAGVHAAPGAQERPAQWVADLASPTQGDRTRATVAISRMDPVPLEVVAGVRALLDHESPGVRGQALMVLGNMGAAATDALPAIHARLDDADPHVRRAAASAMARIPAATRSNRLMLVERLQADDAHQRGRARAALLAVAEDAGDVAPALIATLTTERSEVRTAALSVLRKVPPASAVPLLIPLLRDTHAQTRQSAAHLLAGYGSASAPAVPALVMLLSDGQHVNLALQVLEGIGPGAASAVPQLVELLRVPGMPRETRVRATRVLVAVGGAASPALSTLRGELAAQDLSEATGAYRQALAHALLELSGPGDPALDAYVERLAKAQHGWHAETRVEAVRALHELGPVALPAVPALRESLRSDRYPKIRGLAADALGAIGPPARDALPDLRRARSDSDARVRDKAEAAIEKIDVHAERTEPVPVLPPAKPAPPGEFAAEPSIGADIAALAVQGSRREQAAERLLRRASASLPALHEVVLQRQAPEAQRTAIVQLLAALGEPASVPVLVEVATQQDPALFGDVLRALGSMPPTPAGFDFLRRVLSEPAASDRTRGRAMVALALQREPRARQWAERYRRAPELDLRVSALFLAASLGDATALEPVSTLIAEEFGASFRYSLLLALAELTGPEDFERRAEPARRFAREYDSALRIARFRSGSPSERDELFRPMLMSRFPHERRLAVRDLLARGQVSDLEPLLEEWQYVSSAVRTTVAAELHRAGYRIAERERRLVVEARTH